jgi:hypothetical protein
MDVDECIEAYNSIMRTVFLPREDPAFFEGLLPPFDSARLRAAFKEVVHKRGIFATDLFNDGTDRGCKT